MGMRRYLVVLDMDLLAADEELDLEPISYLGLIADGRIDVPVRTFPLPAIGDAWLAAASSGSRVVVLPG
jgi:hypothetical protein